MKNKKQIEISEIEALEQKLRDNLNIINDLHKIDEQLISIGFSKVKEQRGKYEPPFVFDNCLNIDDLSAESTSELYIIIDKKISTKIRVSDNTATLALKEYSRNLLIERSNLIKELEIINKTLK